jgi:cytochrome o ubiquinol oxidase subunit 2
MRTKLLIVLLSIAVGVLAMVLVLSSEQALVFHPKGPVAHGERTLILTNLGLMALIILPTYALLLTVVWKYCINRTDARTEAQYDPDHSFGLMGECLMWGLPTLVVIAMALVTWKATHHLNPYKPLQSDAKPLSVQVVALDWKWLFIYPDLGIAALNYLVIPERTPVHLRLTADGSPMNSFWVPQLSGQIYSMSGMSTQLYLMADGPGQYMGRAVEINGEGYADMTFPVTSVNAEEFQRWISEVKSSSQHLTADVYEELVKPAVNRQKILFSDVEPDLYPKILDKYMSSMHQVL